MGRRPKFPEAEVLDRATEAFLTTGFEGTSVDDLVRATGLHRGSLYSLFGSKRGAFLRALVAVRADCDDELDLLLVALLELAPRDEEVRGIVADRLERVAPGARAELLGRRLLHRASLDPTIPTTLSRRTS